MAEIRRATPHDVAELAKIISDVWGQNINQKDASLLIKQEKQVIHIAEVNGTIAGFSASFLSPVGAMRRWEVELLAIRPDYQRQGIGQALIATTTATGRAQDVNLIRALVRLDNEDARRSFARQGYNTDGQVYAMYLWEPAASDATIPARGLINVIPVDTLTYRGIWVEGLDSEMVSDTDRQHYLQGARAMAAREERLNVSALIPIENKAMADDLFEDAVMHGHYQWWRYTG